MMVRLMLLLAAVAWATSAGASSLALRDSAASSSCQPNGPATVVDIDTRLAVGATSLDIGTTNVDLISPRTVVEFDPPFDPPATMLSASCSCGDILGLRCDATFLFNASALAEALVGHNITARLGLTNGTHLTTWTRVATVMPTPVLVASDTQLPQHTTTFTVDGHYLGLPAINTRGSDQDLHLFFKDVNDNNVEAQVVQVSDATSATVTFTGGGPQALGPLWACVELWGALTDYVQVATVVKAKSGSGGDKVPWHIIIPVVASVGGVLVIVGVVAWALWLRRRRRCHYETINAYH